METADRHRLCRFARIDKERFGTIDDVTDKGYYTNSYHVDVRENIDAFSKFAFESQFQKISSGGAISYVEIPNMRHNTEALEDVVRFIYDNIQYAEFNTKSDYCHVCGFDGSLTPRATTAMCAALMAKLSSTTIWNGNARAAAIKTIT